MYQRYKIPSKSEPGTYRTVTVTDKEVSCDCPAFKKPCWHIRRYYSWKGDIKGNPDRCFYTHDNRFLDEHHLLRSGLRPYSLTIWLTRWIHERATIDLAFDKHLVDLYFTEPVDHIQFNATVKEVAVRNLESGDKGITIHLQSRNIEQAMKLARLEPQDMVLVSGSGENFYAVVSGVKKENLQHKDDRANIVLSAAPAEAGKVALFGLLPADQEIKVEYNAPTK